MDRYIEKLTDEELRFLINMAVAELASRHREIDEDPEPYNEMLRKLYRKGIITKEQFTEKFKR